MESNFNISTKVNRVSMPTQNKVDTVMKNLGHRSCIAYSEEKDMYYKDGEWVASDLDATILLRILKSFWKASRLHQPETLMSLRRSQMINKTRLD